MDAYCLMTDSLASSTKNQQSEREFIALHRLASFWTSHMHRCLIKHVGPVKRSSYIDRLYFKVPGAQIHPNGILERRRQGVILEEMIKGLSMIAAQEQLQVSTPCVMLWTANAHPRTYTCISTYKSIYVCNNM